MRTDKTKRGFLAVEHPQYPSGETGRLLQASSIIGKYDDALERPGSSALWIGDDYHLNREEVDRLIVHLQAWRATGRFAGQ